MPCIEDALKKIVRRENLSFSEAESSMDEIMAGKASPALLAAWLTALSMKGETADEIGGFASAMRRNAVRIACGDPDVIDTCGTGGDGARTFNISTAAAFVAAGAGATVAKHGNRSVSSRSGSADVLAALGYNLELTAPDVENCLNENGIAFLFAPGLHPAMRHAMPVRRELGIRTVFNILGPLCNPAGARRCVVGVFEEKLCRIVAEALGKLGALHAMVVHGRDGLDEITLCARTKICELRAGNISESDFDPAGYGFPVADSAALKGGDAAANAEILRKILGGDEKGPIRDAVVLNAAAALIVSGKAAAWEDGIAMARRSIDSGAAKAKLTALINASRPRS